MFKELDLREAGGTFFSDIVTLFWRLLDVLFFDIQLAASVIHSNRMMESMTQLMFKGYEESRVALGALLFTLPCCVLIGIEYGLFEKGQLIKVGRRACGAGVLGRPWTGSGLGGSAGCSLLCANKHRV